MSIIKRFSSFPLFIYYSMLLLIIGIFVFYKTFHLALFGDEWQVLYIMKNSIVTGGQWNAHISQAVGPGYQVGALIMYLLTEFFGYDGKTVYVFSFITRFFAALTLFYFLKRRGCSYLASFAGALFFLISPIGLQATEWAKNFTSYISIAFFLLCIDAIFALKSWRNILIFLLTFSFSIYINPIRAPGIILTIIFLLIFQYFFNRALNKNTIFSLFSSLAISLIFSKMFVHSIGSIPAPLENFLGSIGASISLPQPSPYYLILLMATLLLWKRYLLTKKYLLFSLAFHILFITILFGPFLQLSNDKAFIILGIYFTLFMVFVFIIELFNKKISEALNTSLPFLLVVCSLIAPWLVGTLMAYPTHRYLIYSALSLPIIVAFSLNQNIQLGSKEKLFFLFRIRSITICITLILLVMFYLSTNSEINKMYTYHNQDTAKIIWKQIASYFDNYDFKNRKVVAFFDTNIGAIVHDSVTFGYGFHMGYIYKIWVPNINEVYYKTPIAVDSLADFTSITTDGKASKKYLGKDSSFIFPKENAFYFKIDGLKVSRIQEY